MAAPEDPDYETRLANAKDSSLGQVLVKAARLVNERALARVQAVPRYQALKPRHLSVIPHVDLKGTRVTELAERLQITKQGVGQIVDEMQAFGMLHRIPDPEDGRAKLVCFTDQGREWLFDGLTILSTVEADLKEVLGQAELTRLRRSLLKVVHALQEDEG